MDTSEKNNVTMVEKQKTEDCKYGEKCYQKNPEHHKRFKHPFDKSEDVQEGDTQENDNSTKRKLSEESFEKSDEYPKAKKPNTSTHVENKVAKSEVENKVENEDDKKIETESKETDNLYAEAKSLINNIFLVNMPDDFYKLYDFCKIMKPSDPSTAFKIADLKLVGPYDVLSGLINNENSSNPDLLTHWRYYYDPPEFQTVVKGNDKDGLHFGYWRDRPSSDPVFVASNCSEVNYKIKSVAENIFGAIAYYLGERLKKANPFEKTGFSNLVTKLKAYAKQHNINLETLSAKMKSREKNVVAKTIHGAGIVSPFNKKSQVGYRELSVTDNQLLKIINKINEASDDDDRMRFRSELEDVMRLATIAGDECDFGTCLELGHDLFSSGCIYVQNAALTMLNIAYTQLERLAFLKIAEAHVKNRKKGFNLSAIADK